MASSARELKGLNATSMYDLTGLVAVVTGMSPSPQVEVFFIYHAALHWPDKQVDQHIATPLQALPPASDS